MQEIRQAFDTTLRRFRDSRAMQAIAGSDFSIKHYTAILREIYHSSKEDPQAQTLATVYFKGSDRDMVTPFLKHAMARSGHDQLALADLEKLGVDVEEVKASFPLPATLALTGYIFYQINYLRPVGYLGYLYFLEHMQIAMGEEISLLVAATGVPPECTSYLQGHAAMDMNQDQQMLEYIEALVHDDADIEAINNAITVTGELYAQMLWAGIESAGGVELGVTSGESA